MQTDGSAGGVRSLLTPIGKLCGQSNRSPHVESVSPCSLDARLFVPAPIFPCMCPAHENLLTRIICAQGASYYGRSRSLSPEHYQELMDRGWRRSGTLLYLPDVLRSCCPHYTIREKKRNHVFHLARSVHESERSQLHSDLESDHNFVITLEVDNFSEEKYQLFDNYQRHVHHEGDSDITRAGFKRFLCSSPIQARHETNGKPLGSFHQCYRLDGRLIAMGVLDLLPHSVSGVYFLYHSDFEKWSFGKLSALRELTLAMENGYEHYYMGYYIHGCKKMRYKGDYKPQYVLDYDSLEWDVLNDEMRALMDRPKYTSMSRERARHAVAKATKEAGGDGDVASDKIPDVPVEEDEILFPNPVEAFASNLSLLDLGMPGVMTLDQVKRDIDLDNMQVSVGRGNVHRMQEMVSWHAGSETDGTSFKGIIAEFAAAVGSKMAREIVVDLCR
nr:arginyl-trna--protein transferase 1 [Quercus suber]